MPHLPPCLQILSQANVQSEKVESRGIRLAPPSFPQPALQTPRRRQPANGRVPAASHHPWHPFLYPFPCCSSSRKVRRLTTELKRYQLRFPRAAAEAAAFAAESAGPGAEIGGGAEGGETGKGLGRGQVDDAADDLPPWVTSSEVMSPLLSAYDARIQVWRRGCCVTSWCAAVAVGVCAGGVTVVVVVVTLVLLGCWSLWAVLPTGRTLEFRVRCGIFTPT